MACFTSKRGMAYLGIGLGFIGIWTVFPVSHAGGATGVSTAPTSDALRKNMLFSSANVSVDLDAWLKVEIPRAIQGMFQNISPPGAARGAVVASLSQQNPDYFYCWIRDAALVMGAVVGIYERVTTLEHRSLFMSMLSDYIDFSRQNQLTPNRSGGLGEPKFNVDGSAFNGDWGRPQNDSPALRAITLIRYAKDLLAQGGGNDSWVRSKLYDGQYPTQSVIKADLEYVSNHWQDSSFDIWEEVRGQHFYTEMVQRRALLEGADLANQLGDPGAATWYREQAKQIEGLIQRHWDSGKGYLVATVDQDTGISYKDSGLDVEVILGALHGEAADGFFGPSSDPILITALRLRQTFQNLYPINSIPNLLPTIGRYPEDHYDGYEVGVNPGNGWVLATNAFAELYFRVLVEWSKQGKIAVTSMNLPFLQALISENSTPLSLVAGQILYKGTLEFSVIMNDLMADGNGFLNRVKYHTPADGTLSEQINRDNGYMQGATGLGWSYESLLSAFWARIEATVQTLK